MPGKLFIIGNGFDLFHHLPTTYYDLREYFKRPIDYHDWLGVPSEFYYQNPIVLMDNMIINTAFTDTAISGNTVFVSVDPSAPFNNLYRNILIERGIPVMNREFLWRDFEEVLGRIDFSEYLEDEDYGPHLIQHAFDYLQTGFTSWINSISTSHVTINSGFSQLFDRSQDLFLTFNYTDTLERVYNIPNRNICHIHGKIGEELVFGHSGINQDDFLKKNNAHGFEDFSKRIFSDFTKNSRAVLRKHGSFFQRLKDIEDIYVIGFSFSPCDLRYICEICYSTPSANWHLSNYDSDEQRKKYINILRHFGAKGIIDTFILPPPSKAPRKKARFRFSRFIRAALRSWIFQTDPIWERMIFGFHPKNEDFSFKKPYIRSFFSIILIIVFCFIGLAGVIEYWIRKVIHFMLKKK